MRNKTVSAACVLGLSVWWLALPVLSYNNGTSENVSVEVVAQPFLDGDSLTYRWSGDVVRSCAVDIRREIVDSENVVTRLTTRTFAALPSDVIGPTSYEITVQVPVRIAEGPATYYATEVPRCTWLQYLFPVAIEYPPVHFVVSR